MEHETNNKGLLVSLNSISEEGFEVTTKNYFKQAKIEKDIEKEIVKLEASILGIEEFIRQSEKINPLDDDAKIELLTRYISNNKSLKDYANYSGDPRMAYALIKSKIAAYNHAKNNDLIGNKSRRIESILKYTSATIFTGLLAFLINTSINNYHENSFNRNKQYEYNLNKVKYLQDKSTFVYNSLKTQRPILATWEKFSGKISPKMMLKEPRNDIEDIIIKSMALPNKSGEKLSQVANGVALALSDYEKCLSKKFIKGQNTKKSPFCTSRFDLSIVKKMAIQAGQISIN